MFTSNSCKHKFYYGRTTSRSCSFQTMARKEMAHIQCALSGIALNYFLRLDESYKKDRSVLNLHSKNFYCRKLHFLHMLKLKLFSKQKQKTYVKKALRVQKLVEKGWCNESAAFINLKCNEIFTQGLSKKLKDFALKRQKK